MSARHSAQDAPSAAESHARRSLLARIHCLRRDAGWSEDEYRDILQGRTGKRSAADLDFAALGKVIDQLAPLVASQVKARAANDWAFIDKASAEKRPLLRKVFAVCRALGAGRRYAEGIAKRQSGGVARRLEMMSYEELHKLVAALVNTQRSKAAAAAKTAAVTPPGAQP
ncbi:phage protein GemA/Gp16 family protein [Accumulibacter sp.]|uniref:phage protein GemA/Gp16 family protein n=1 Tax=Accumulibacter sp. TaxID=2053492 RepID=UPI002607D8D5|nr:phage protein GemA/Gp16 family protein [Accumulibacter sp.]